MKLIRVGNKFINMDKIVWAKYSAQEKTLLLYCNVADLSDYLVLDGDEAVDVHRWMLSNSSDLRV